MQAFENVLGLISSQPSEPAASTYQAVVKVPLSGVRACFGIRTRADALTSVEVLSEASAELCPQTSLAAETVDQLQAYFRHPGWRFSLPLCPAHTPFQRRVREALMAIPSGETRTYGELARQVGGGPQAVGGACRSNPLPIVIPCHRVVSAAGLGGYMGDTAGTGLVLKAKLLAHECSV